MKRPILLLALLAAPRFVIAQPVAQPQPAQAAPNSKITDDNLDGLSLIANFYNTITHAKSYSGHFLFLKRQFKDGKSTGDKALVWKSAWVGDGNGVVRQSHVQTRYTEVEGERRTEVEGMQLNDGTTSYSVIPARNVWSQRPSTQDSDYAQIVARTVWTTTLLSFNNGLDLKRSKRVGQDNSPQIVFSGDHNSFEAVFDEKSGTLQSWEVQGKDGEFTQLVFFDLQINPTLSDGTFVWNQPVDAKEVPPEETAQNFQF